MAVATELQPVVDVTSRLQALLDLAREVKPATTVEPPLPTTEILDQVNSLHESFDEGQDQNYRFAVVETAAREIFYALITSTSIQDPAFVEVWNLLDIVTLCGDEEFCSADLVCSLTEELLDSQTTDGCHIVFSYLESRRERLARKHFHRKHAFFLRSCNELLRRLSRAEDPILCGRVFFFLFQTFPLGDKSSVNLRGEFHVENTTKFEVPEPQPEQNGDKMEVDPEPAKADPATPGRGTPQPSAKAGSKAVPIKAPPKKVEEEVISNNELYPIFWRLQQDFSDPNRLFAPDHFQAFKKGLANTIVKFKNTPTVVQTKSADGSKRGTKRKLGYDGSATVNSDSDSSDHFVDNYNPKYLTSRDLFDLELSDLAFQRHILVQALILIDYLLSLTEKVKKRLATLDAPNKSMLSGFTLSEEDTKWATSTRSTISAYLSGTHEGKLFNRMVETVLARDKNWVRWKIESCPSIVRDPVSTESELDARKGARDATRIRRVPEKPVGSMDLSFLEEGSGGGLEALKDPSRYTAPSIDELIDGIKTDELDLEMAMGEEETESLQNAIANKRWRILRETRATQLAFLDKVEPGKDLEEVFRPRSEPEVSDLPVEEDGEGVATIVITEAGESAAIDVAAEEGEVAPVDVVAEESDIAAMEVVAERGETAPVDAVAEDGEGAAIDVVEEMDVAEGDESADAVVDPEQGESAATIVVTESVALVLDGGENSETNVPTMDIEAVEKVEIPGGVEENAADTGT